VAVYGLDITSKTQDFSYGIDGKVVFLSGKERSERNFKKMLITQKGIEGQTEDNDDRYNPLYGTRLDEYVGTSAKSINESVLKSKIDLEAAASRFVQAQDAIIDFMEEEEYFARIAVAVASYKGIGIFFTMDVFTAQDLRLGNDPSMSKQFFVGKDGV
jgi:hypothetical protein